MRMIDLRGRIPQDIKFKIIGRASMGLLKGGDARGHDPLGDDEGGTGIQGIAAGPEFSTGSDNG